jgi:hypothetical protein
MVPTSESAFGDATGTGVSGLDVVWRIDKEFDKMSEQKMTRRELLAKAAGVGVVLVGAGALLSACKSEGGAPAGGAAPAAAASCDDVSALSDADKKTRESLKYVSKTPDAAKRCDGCSLYIPGSPCGGCKVVKGPIAAEGWCSAWAPKPA